LKPALSFLTLLHECDDADYYAYCDQDDYWYPNKLKTAVEELEGIDEPALFVSTYDVCNEKLEKIFTFDMKFEEPVRLEEVLLYRAPSACNMVFNHKLREAINRSNPSFVRMHDFWTFIVALSHNYPVITKYIPLIKSRQHSGESVGITPTVLTRLKRLVISYSRGDNERWRQAKEAYIAYNHEIPDDKKDILETVVRYRSSYRNRIRLIRDKRFKTNNRYINFLFKLSVLAGKF
jgi:rhamnosyltransferase